MSRDYRLLMRDLAQDYECFSDIPVLKLYEPALAWWMSRNELDCYEPFTECPRATYIKLWQVMGPSMMEEFIKLMHKQENRFQDVSAKLAIEIASAVTMYALHDLSDAFDYEKDMQIRISDEEADDRIQRAADMRREVA